MTWVLVVVLAVVAFVAIAFVLKAPRSGWEAIAAALVLGIAGYASQASPGLPAAPKAASEQVSKDAAAMVDARGKVSDSSLPPSDRWVVIADGLARNGRYGDAAEVLRGAVDADPKNTEAWLAMGNALVSHADGLLTPAALYAFRKAALSDPDAPGPPFFLGLAFAQSGRYAEARQLWSDLLERAPEDAPWRAPLADQLSKLEAFLAGQSGGQGPSSGQSTP
ncbi:tetratricopeptide repeat protein [Novosphingobium sp. PP1Y]|uniref:tetratricopeptide repeat protein n=1 Tax=Novosphingobium sp. PP1Y TaxID=702113 RepID=UPI00020EEB9B|nr:tetratricopeptide repeat protein [Novosphingobium sp. PP1Y]CCA92329.1 tetratricopeptide TPR_4 [Novosphingobium sp. PP1Y]